MTSGAIQRGYHQRVRVKVSQSEGERQNERERTQRPHTVPGMLSLSLSFSPRGLTADKPKSHTLMLCHLSTSKLLGFKSLLSRRHPENSISN